MLRIVWKIVETKAGKTGVVKIKIKREEGERGKETRRKKTEGRRKEKEKTKER